METTKTPELNSVADVAAVLEETNRFLLERGMYLCPWEGVSVKPDRNGCQRAQVTIVALEPVSKEYLKSLIRRDGEGDSPH